MRYDRAWSFTPAEHNGTELTSPFNAAPISFPKTLGVDSFNDITPRLGVAYDVFGTGKTALKFNLGHYLDSATNDSEDLPTQFRCAHRAHGVPQLERSDVPGLGIHVATTRSSIATS